MTGPIRRPISGEEEHFLLGFARVGKGFEQRLAAAIISYQLGRPTVDGTLKQYVGGNLDPWWEEKALELYKEVNQNRDAHPLAPPEEHS
jgi:hypothetical protein